MLKPRFGAFALVSVILGAAVGACSSSTADTGGAGSGNGTDSGAANGGDSGSNGHDTSTADGSGGDGGAQCRADAPAWCKAYNVATHCNPAVGWVDQTCPDGCYAGQCSTTACADECNLGDTSAAGTCQLWSVASSSVVASSPATSTSDRARDYDGLLRTNSMPEGAVAYAQYTDATRTTIAGYADLGDSSIFTGSALAAEAWRLSATGSADANARVDAMAQTLDTWMNVSGDAGYLARFAHLHGSTLPEGEVLCTNTEMHCSVAYNGKTYDWLGVTSRDQYTGAMLGFHLAYLASPNETTRAMIRKDVVTIANELMKTRTNLPVHVIIDGVPIDKTVTISNVILATSEMTNGKVTVTVDTSDASSAELVGMREFLPDYGTLVTQVIPLGGVPINRPSTAMMLGAFFRMAMEMTKDVPGSESDYTTISGYYAANADAWLTVAQGWTFSANCGSGYFANHIAYIMAYVWAALEDDPTRGPQIRDTIFANEMWNALQGHKSSYFAYLWAATRATTPTPQITAANTQLAEFTAGPRVHAAVDSLTKYTHDATCMENGYPEADNATEAVDIQDRPIQDFAWQRDPWGLKDLGDATQVYPGVDYLVAYWAARKNGFMADDHAGTCAKWVK